MNNNNLPVNYPRRVFIRRGMIALGRLLFTLLARVEINGRENLPIHGPAILAGNHVAALEAVLMAVYSPALVEFFGNGDIPFDPNYAFIVKAYDLIPVNRGNLDRENLQKALDILKQGGVLGIFPEGGIWNPSQMRAQTGVALLSHRSQSPVIPIGFGGVRDGLQKVRSFQRPKLVMNVGKAISPVEISDPSLSIKSNLEIAARHILAEINTLIPEEDQRHHHRRVDEDYRLDVKVFSNGERIAIPDVLVLTQGNAYAHLLYSPTLLDVLVRNLRLPIRPLKKVNQQSDLEKVLIAFDAILAYLNTNPGFFTYRFGVEEGLAVKESLSELHRLATWAHESGYQVNIQPTRQYRNANSGAQVVESGGCFPKSFG